MLFSKRRRLPFPGPRTAPTPAHNDAAYRADDYEASGSKTSRRCAALLRDRSMQQSELYQAAVSECYLLRGCNDGGRMASTDEAGWHSKNARIIQCILSIIRTRISRHTRSAIGSMLVSTILQPHRPPHAQWLIYWNTALTSPSPHSCLSSKS